MPYNATHCLMKFLLTGSILLGMAGSAHAAVTVERIEGQTVYLSGQPPFKLDLFNIKLLGTLKASDHEVPYLLLSAKPCDNCSNESSIYLVHPGMKKPFMYVYPGKIIEGKTGTLLLESRAFFGRCLNSHSEDVLVFFQKERIDKKKNLQNSVLIAQPGHEHVHEQLMERSFPKLPKTVQLVRARQCKEIDGRNRLMAAKPLDVRIRSHKNEADSLDSDDTPKENQTDADLSSGP